MSFDFLLGGCLPRDTLITPVGWECNTNVRWRCFGELVVEESLRALLKEGPEKASRNPRRCESWRSASSSEANAVVLLFVSIVNAALAKPPSKAQITSGSRVSKLTVKSFPLSPEF
jgi:hypothetical protein